MAMLSYQDTTYESKVAVEQELMRLVERAGVPALEARECAAHLAPCFEAAPSLRPARRGYQLIRKTWAIKADDFAFFEQMAPLIVAVAVIACDPASPGSAAGLVASAVATAISLPKRLRDHAVRITEIEYGVLTTLVARGAPTDVLTLASVLRRRDEFGPVSKDEVSAALARLSEATNIRGDDRALVATRDGTHWTASGL